MTPEEIQSKLHSTKSPDRRRAAKEIGKLRLTDYGDVLYQSYLKEATDKRTWETQVEMILALGMLDYKRALTEIEQIIETNRPHDTITYAAAQSCVRLKRQSINDASPCLELLRFGGLSIVDGCLNPLGYDKMRPDETQIIELIKLSWDLHKHKDRLGYEANFSDPRYGLAAACAGWNRELTIGFLEHCLATAGRDAPLRYVSENSLKGKYVKLR